MRTIIRTLFIFTAVAISSCSNNLFSEFASRSSDDALLYEAQRAVNSLLFDTAIDIIKNQMSSSGQSQVRAREILASAYAGKCGLNFTTYVQDLANATSGSVFVLVSSPFVGKTVDPASCLLGLQTLDLIGTNAQRTLNQNAFASVLGMVLMGSATRLYTDNNPVDGDGTQDAADISCGISNANMDNVILGYAYMAQNYNAISASIGGSSSTTITDSIAICTGLAGGSCTNTDPAQISAGMRDTMRDLMNTTQYGVGTADGSNPMFIPVACP